MELSVWLKYLWQLDELTRTLSPLTISGLASVYDSDFFFHAPKFHKQRNAPNTSSNKCNIITIKKESSEELNCYNMSSSLKIAISDCGRYGLTHFLVSWRLRSRKSGKLLVRIIFLFNLSSYGERVKLCFNCIRVLKEIRNSLVVLALSSTIEPSSLFYSTIKIILSCFTNKCQAPPVVHTSTL